MSADVQGLELVQIRSKDNYRIRGLQIDENANPLGHLSPSNSRSLMSPTSVQVLTPDTMLSRPGLATSCSELENWTKEFLF